MNKHIWSQNPAIEADLACPQLTNALKASALSCGGDISILVWGVVRVGMSSPVQIAVIKTLNNPLKLMITKILGPVSTIAQVQMSVRQ